MRLYWMRTSEAFPDSSWPETSFTLFDEDKPHREGDGLWETYVASVQLIEAGPEGRLWSWSVTATFPGPRCPFASNRREATRKQAADKAAETYRKMVAYYDIHTPEQWRWRGL